MYSLIAFATQWGSKLGGINSFNTDFLKAFGIAFHNNAQVICIVTEATTDEVEEARNAYVMLIKLPYKPQEKTFSQDQAKAAIETLNQHQIGFDRERTVWLGHDRITGSAAIEAAKIAGGRSALIHHMSYDHYESFAEDSRTAYSKSQEQRDLFEQADLALAIGPLLRKAAEDLVGKSKLVHMLVPGLAEISAKPSPNTFVAFLGGRLTNDAARIKQGYLGIAALAQAQKEACERDGAEGLRNQPKIVLRGVDFATEEEMAGQPNTNPEAELKSFAEDHAGRAINLQALPYTHDRMELYDNISRASVVLMPSWHEGFGLAAWEAIAAGVPLIISKQSGVYQLLEENHPGCEEGFIYPIDVRGTNTKPFFRPEDATAVAKEITKIADKPEKARQKSATLRGLLLDKYTWPACAAQAMGAFGWALQKGNLPDTTQKPITPALDSTEFQPAHNELPVHMPERRWRVGGSVADSQLLRAEEMLVPFDPARQPELDNLNTWLDDAQYPQAVRLITGAGGLGKTRLALHLCQQRLTSGWYAGFMDSDLTAKELSSGWKALKTLNQPLLVIIDYAETRQDNLLSLIRAMLQSPTDQPVRFLLLARNGGEWWDNLPGKNKDCESLLSGYATSGPYPLPPLHNEIGDRQHAYRQALHAFSAALNVPAPDVTPELAGEHFGRPLYLQMAALLALRGERPTSAQGMTRALLHHERRYWHGLFIGHDILTPALHAEQLMALTTLSGGFTTPKIAWPSWEKVSGKVISTAQFNHLFYTLIPLYPGKHGLQAVRPDLLGEALVAQALLRSNSAELLDAVLGKNTSQSVRLQALTTIARLFDHYPELQETLTEALVRHFAHCWQEFILVATETPSNLSMLAEGAFMRLPTSTKNQISGLLKSRLKDESIQLAQLYCVVANYLVENRKEKYLKKSDDIPTLYEYSWALDIYAFRLNRIGLNDEALRPAKLAMEIDEQLSRKNPNKFELNLAVSLNNYNEMALTYSKRSLEIYLRQQKNDSYEDELAAAQTNYANCLNNKGDYEIALDHADQAMKIYRQLALKKPEQFESRYAGSLNNLSNALSYVGRNSESFEYARLALEIHERLSQEKPDYHEPDLAMSLNNYANRLSDEGRYDDALVHARLACEIYERLSKKNPARFAGDQFWSVGSTHFFEWLLNNDTGNHDLSELNSVPSTSSQHHRPLLQLYAAFVHGCCIADATVQTDALIQVTALWKNLSHANRTAARNYWLCAAAWCSLHEPASITELDWQTEWKEFHKQRRGNTPRWMQEVAQRLGYRWPIE
ncbi:hypothetical protein FGKAn22_06400 [Ferrigenium kumadai]|uniref:Glycosyltransferase n=1 Tax=Ferrigenium kumadai TaxID=1682490 RepID=A0AAN1SYA7_9PROT|nr:tetratricopeptide repeat protein [Ferrigenium kumadai]BBI98947.1 hypothetical protein FGKAn22_06400 [Ferrigenium kumadai]